jgi:hypothetical protein
LNNLSIGKDVVFGIINQLPKIITFPQLTALSIIVPEIYNLATNDNSRLTNSLNNLINEVMKIAAFSLAKAVAVTIVTFSYYNPIKAAIASGVILYEGYNMYNDVIYEGKELATAIYDSSLEVISIALTFGLDYIF